MVDMDLTAYWYRQVTVAIKSNGGQPLKPDYFFKNSNVGIDSNNDGKITLDEMKKYIRAREADGSLVLKDGWEAAIEAEFKRIDTDNSGYITDKEVVEAYKKSGKVANIAMVVSE